MASPSGVSRLKGLTATDEQAVERATAEAGGDGEPRSDTFASGKYRKAMAAVFVARAVARAGTR